jgi:hypothetical protein
LPSIRATGGGQRHPTQAPDPQPAEREADDEATDQLGRDLDGHEAETPFGDAGQRRVAGQDDQQHRGSVVEPRLRLQHSPEPVRYRDVAQHGEHGRRVGRRGHGPQQHRDPDVEAQHVVPEQGHQPHTERGPAGGEDRRHPHSGFDVGPPGGQPAFGQDQHQRGETEVPGQLGVVERDVQRTRLAEQHAEAQEQQQGRQPDLGAEPSRRDGGDQHHGREQHDAVEGEAELGHRVLPLETRAVGWS